MTGTIEKLKFNNGYMTLIAASMNKLHEINYITSDTTNGIYKDSIGVSILFDREVMSEIYAIKKPRADLEEGARFYMKVDNKYYAVGLVSNNQKDINQYLIEHKDYGLIATDMSGFHYTASLKPAKEKKQK